MELNKDAGTWNLKLSGRLDANTAPEVMQAMTDAVFERLEIEIGELAYISSAGLRALLVCSQAAATCGGSMVVLHPKVAVLNILKLSGFAKMLHIVE